MPKIKKGKKKAEKYEEEIKKLSEMKFDMFSSSIKSLLIGAIFLIISFLFNRNILPFNIIENFTVESIESGSIEDVLLIAIKSLSIILFFTFVIIGLANTQELIGKPLSLFEITIVSIISLIQSFPSINVFWISFGGILLILFYFWLVQIKVETI
ncbi:MAG: hypothetical protein GY870_11850 [archaeon]|nr:hypothetical protein [archaeon]